jgi:regulator of sigma E protease
MMLTVLSFVFVFGILVFVHELGHFLAARFFKVRVDEFAFGFPPRIWGKRIKDTEYAINAIPIGGYVKLLGEVGAEPKDATKEELAQIRKDAKNPENLQNKKPWQRAVIFASGVTMNFILAWLLLTAFYAFGGRPLLPNMFDSKLVQNNQKVVVTQVTKDTPAQKVGVSTGDQILSIDDKKVYDANSVFSAIQSGKEVSGLKTVKIKLLRAGTELEKSITTYKETREENGLKVDVQRIGIEMVESGTVKTSLWAAPIVVGLWDFFKQIFTQFKVSKDVGGPIAIAQISGAAAKLGISALIQVMAVLSIAVAIMNILPFPALDGGHILFLAIEKLIRREVPAKLKNAVNYAGFGLLLLLMAVVTFSDLSRIGLISFLKGLF